MMKPLLFAGVLGLIAVSNPLAAQEATTKEQLIGSWSVVSLKATSDDKVSYPLGEKPAGFVTITPTRFWLLFVDSTRKTPASPALTNAEAIAMMKTQVAWTGKYAIGEQTLAHAVRDRELAQHPDESVLAPDLMMFLEAQRLFVPGGVVSR